MSRNLEWQILYKQDSGGEEQDEEGGRLNMTAHNQA